jgi:two-component system chemotaxis sensor kinase CheA
MKNVLETAGYEVKTAVDGLEAYELLLSQPIDLLVTDVEMPRMDGFTLTGKVRGMDKFKNLPVIICTSRGSREDRERGIELGANAYIDKSSFTQQGLLNFAKKLL